MRIATIGTCEPLEQREKELAKLADYEFAGRISDTNIAAAVRDVDVLFVAVPSGERFEVARQAMTAGTHVFLEWPPVTSLQEGEAIVRLAEEAGLEAGISRPLRFHEAFRDVSLRTRPNLIAVDIRASPDEFRRLPVLLGDAVDLACTLARTSAVRRIDAEVARDDTSLARTLAANLRFHSGAYAQIYLGSDTVAYVVDVRAAGSGSSIRTTLNARDVDLAVAGETAAFLTALSSNSAVPVSALDALHTMRIVERIMSHSR